MNPDIIYRFENKFSMTILSEAKSCLYDHYHSNINSTKEQLEAIVTLFGDCKENKESRKIQ